MRDLFHLRWPKRLLDRRNRWLRRPRRLTLETIEGRLMTDAAAPHEVAAEVAFVNQEISLPIDLAASHTLIESQGWWDERDGSQWHLHLAAAVPLGLDVRGRMSFSVRATLHDEPAGTWVKTIAVNDGGDLGRVQSNQNFTQREQPGFVLDAESGTRSFVFPVSFDTSKQRNGVHILSVRANVMTPDGRQFFTEFEFHYRVVGGRGSAQDRFNGWSQGIESWRASTWSKIQGKTNYERMVFAGQEGDVPAGSISFRFRFSEARQLVATLDRGHVIPAVGDWRMQAASTGAIVKNAPIARSAREFTLLIPRESLAPGWHSIDLIAFTAAGSHPKTKIWFQV